jgi:TetR/AcrR family tetracycline transcriptional repressor
MYDAMSRGERPGVPGQPRRGRPPKLSRARILAAAIDLLDSEPPESLTMARVATALGVAPMSLYTHVTSREDLLDSAAALALDGLVLAVPTRGSWRTRVRAWAIAVARHVRRHPQALRLLRRGSRLSPPWLHARAVLVRALAAGGLEDRALSDAVRWTTQTVLGALLLEQLTPPALWVEGDPAVAFEAIADLDDGDRATLEPLLAYMGGRDRDTAFAYTIDRILAALDALVPG